MRAGACRGRLNRETSGVKALSERPALQPYWGKPAVRNDRGDNGNFNPEKKELNCNHGVLITDEIFDAYLKCKTKAHLTFGPARSGEPSHRNQRLATAPR